ncbi:hypothetical protein, partial [Streptosporangium sp. OZ121]|uniref:hypothetical protein n=1 Tax=Streptosporangium sp. OZ121 TaxID=3444183 RepID=UPI003F7A8A2A
MSTLTGSFRLAPERSPFPGFPFRRCAPGTGAGSYRSSTGVSRLSATLGDVGRERGQIQRGIEVPPQGKA